MDEDRGAVAAHAHGIARSPHWPAVEHAFRTAHPSCVHCPPGRVSAVNVHHVWPFHLVVSAGRPDLELDPRNLITLCRDGDDSHLLLGHLDDFKSYNTDILQHAAVMYHGMAADEIRANAAWQNRVKQRPADKLDTEALKALKLVLDAKFPIR